MTEELILKLEKINKPNFNEQLRTLVCQKLNITDDLCNQYFTEYRKFLFLAMNSKEMITPSEQVDHIWHAHIT